jgi:hypothetical protein
MKASQAVELLKELGDKHIAVQWFSKEDYEQNTGMRKWLIRCVGTIYDHVRS